MSNLSLYPHSGKFEGELALAPLAYAASLDGFGEPYDFGSEGCVDHYTVCQWSLEPTDEEIAEHELTAADVAFARNLLGFIVHESDAGFVSVSWYEKGEEVAMCEAVGKLDSAMGEFEREQENEDA